jgi:hypothetical protein
MSDDVSQLPPEHAHCPACNGTGEIDSTVFKPGPGRFKSAGTREWMLNALAGGVRPTAIAAALNCNIASVYTFRRANMAIIEDRQKQNAEDMRDVWVTSKRARLAELAEDILSLGEMIEAGDVDVIPALRAKHAALRQAAEEVGEAGTSISVTYTLPGVNMDAV